MLTHCVPVNLQLFYKPHSTPNELLWHRFLVGELNRITKVVYARPHLRRTQSLSRNTEGFDLVLSGPKERLTLFLSRLRGLQMDRESTVRSSSVKLGQVIEKDHNQELDNVCDSLEQQCDITRRQKAYGLRNLAPLVRVAPWIFDSSPGELQPANQNETLKHKIDNFYAAASNFQDADQLIALEARLYQNMESMPLPMRTWFRGAIKNHNFEQRCHDRLDMLTHGFKKFT